MLCRYTLKRLDIAEAIEAAVAKALEEGLRTPDIHTPGMELVGCIRMGECVKRHVEG
jgi:3-isopropylmalate dehydrogenase